MTLTSRAFMGQQSQERDSSNMKGSAAPGLFRSRLGPTSTPVVHGMVPIYLGRCVGFHVSRRTPSHS